MAEILEQYSTDLKVRREPHAYVSDLKYDAQKALDYEQKTSVEGENKSDAVYYDIPRVNAGDLIKASEWEALRQAIENEKERRSKEINYYSKDTNNYYNYDFDALIQQVGNIITASDYNKMVSVINSMGKECVCNCNYCTCNCNYCECNCNYCTCNCNHGCICNCAY